MSGIQTLYKETVAPQLREQFSFKNIHQVPRVTKVVLNMGLGQAIADPKLVDRAVEDLGTITGQKAVIRRAKKSISNFKLREGMPIGASVTLRRQKMHEFMDRLIHVALPRVRDFRGISRKAFDGNGNYTLGITEQIIFPEIDLDKTQNRGLNVTFVTNARTNEEGLALLEGLGMPFRK